MSIERQGVLHIDRVLSGGVQFRVGGLMWVYSPSDAIKVAEAILQCAGVNVVFSNTAPVVTLAEKLKNGAAKIILP